MVKSKKNDSKLQFLQRKLIFILLAIIFLLIVFTFSNYGTTFDEQDVLALGKNTLLFYASFGRDTSFLKLSIEPEFFLTHGSILEITRTSLLQSLSLNSIEYYHLFLALFSLLGFYFIYKLVLLITKSYTASTVSFFFLLFMPRFYGDIFTNSKDIGAAVLLLPTIYFSIKYFSEQKISTSIVIGMLFALVVSLRPALLYIYLIFLVISLIQSVLTQSFKKYLKFQAVTFSTFVVLFYLSSPYLLLKPLEILNIISASEKYPYPGAILFQGIMYNPESIPWYYLPTWITITTPLVTLLFFAIGVVYLIYSIFKENLSLKLLYSYLLLIFFVPLILIFFKKPVIYDAWRQFLFLSGPIVIISALGVFSLIKSGKIIRYMSFLILLLGAIFIAREMVFLHPYQYIYFNSLVGGLENAHNKFETDYWGATFKEATDWIKDNKTKKDKKLYVFPCIPHLAIPYLGSQMEINNEKAKIRYCFTRWGKNNEQDGKVVYEVKRKGVVLNIVKQK